MTRTSAWILTCSTLFIASGAYAGETTTDVKLKSGDGEIRAVLAMPDGAGPFPAVVVIQEWWGLTDWIADNAKRLASKGYVALAPDLYHGKIAESPEVAGQLLKGLPRDRAMRDLKTAVDELVKNPKVKKDKIGVIGWCMGGGFALELALRDDRVSACAICYGRPYTTAGVLKPLKASVLGIYGKYDQGIPADSVHEFEKALRDADKKVEGMHLFPAGHGFMRPNNGPGKPNPAYREGSAKEGWEKIDQFFQTTLGS